MRNYVIAGVCLVGGIAWAVSLSFAPTAKPSIGQSQLAPSPLQAAVEPVTTPVEHAMPAIAWETKTGEQVTAEVQAEVQARTTAPAPSDETASINNPVVHAALEPAVRADAVEPAQAAEPAIPAIAAEPKTAEQIMAEIKAAITPSTDKPSVLAALEPGIKADVADVQKGCPNNPDAIGTSRVLTISASEYSLLGTMQYKQTLPLKDHEVVLTFDDGPIAPYTNSILETLAANCVKATYFLVGEMAQARPYLVRHIYNAGHSIGTHSQNHPFGFERLSMERVVRQVNGGISSVDAALGDPKAISPFFRIPGLGRTSAIEHFLESEGLITWSADIDTNDWWRGSSPGAIVKRAMQRLNARGRGIILMHDIHPATALALPTLLKELKANGYHVVHVVATGDRPKALPDLVASAPEKEAWPRIVHVSTEKDRPAKTKLRHRVKVALAHHRHRRGAERSEAGKINYSSTSSIDQRSTRSY